MAAQLTRISGLSLRRLDWWIARAISSLPVPDSPCSGSSPAPRGGYLVHTSGGEFTADQVIVASGGYQVPIIPRLAERVPAEIEQIHCEQYRNADLLPAGNVLVVGSGQSGAQLAEDLHLAGRKVFLAAGDAPRCTRFYQGRDVVDWLQDMKY
jgi:putative flavoprotein involved in K+ transport